MASKAQQFIYAMRAKYEGKAEVAALSSDLKAMGDIKSFQKLQDDFAETTASLTDAKAKTRELRKLMNAPGGEAFKKSYEQAADEVKKLSKSLIKQKSALDSGRQSIQKQGFAMNDLTGEYEKLDASTKAHGQKIAALKTLGVESYASIEQKIKSLHAAYKILEKDPSTSASELRAAKVKMEADIASLTGKTGKLTTKFDHLKAGIAGIAGLTAGSYIFGNMIGQTGDAARELENAARVAGTSVEELSALAYATESVGISQEKLADMSKDVKDKIGDFIENGGGEFKDFFENVAPLVDVTAEELIKMSGPDCLVAIKKAMDDANISAENQTFYLEAIANDASLLTPLLQDNGRALKEKADRARELGIAISDMDNAKLVEMAQANKDLGKTMGALSREVVSAVAPALQVLMGHAQKAVAWFNELSPGVQRFIVFAGSGTAVVTALGMAFAPLISTVTLGAPLITGIATGVGAMSTKMGLGVIASKALGVAMKGIPFVGVALLVYQIGAALGWWEPIMNVVKKGAISLAAGVHLLGLKIRWLWNVLTGDAAEAAAIEKRMTEVDEMYGEMFANIGKKQDDHLEKTKENQKQLTDEVRKGASDRLSIEQEAQKKIDELRSGDGTQSSPGKEDNKKGKTVDKEEKPDEFGLLPSERKSIDDEVAKLDAIRGSKNGSGYKKEKNDDGTWGVVLEQEDTSSEKKGKTTASAKANDFGLTPSERKSMDKDYNALVENSRNRIDSLQQYQPKNNRSAQGEAAPPVRVVEIKLPSASVYTAEDSTEKVIADLQRMGAMA